MRTTALAATALTAAALLAGGGTAMAEEADPVDTVGPADTVDTVGPVDTETSAGCVSIPVFAGLNRCMNVDPAAFAPTSGSGYGSFGTGSLMDLLSGLINTGSVVLSVDLPNATGSYAPGSLGSYGPEASIGGLLTVPTASLRGAS